MSFVSSDGTTVDHHRNGVSGVGFYVCHFDSEYGRMMAVVFDPDEWDEDEYKSRAEMPFHNCRVAVFNEEQLPDTRFGHNSWRGDEFSERCYRAIDEFDAYLGSPEWLASLQPKED